MKKTVRIPILSITVFALALTLSACAYLWGPSLTNNPFKPKQLAFSSNGNGTCSVTGIGSYTDTDLVIPSTSPDGDTVTAIGQGAFSGCTELTSVTIPDSVTNIGNSAFSSCSGLTSVTIPDGVTSIGKSAFYDCSGLTSVTIPDSVTSIGNSAFSGCSGLVSITIPFVGAQAGKTASNTYQYPFGYIFGTDSYTGGTATTQDYYGSSTRSTTSSTYYIPSSLRSVTITGGNIFYGAFHNCSGLTSITLGDGVTSIGRYAFSGCSGLTSVTFSDGIQSIGDHAFSGCASLKKITVPDGVSSIEEGTFSGCTGLTSVTVPDGVTSIGAAAFSGCSSLQSIMIPFVGESKTTAHYPFGYIFGTDYYTGGVATEQYYHYRTGGTAHSSFCIPASLKSVTVTGGNVPYGAFYNCSGLTSVTVGDGVANIESFAFYGCSSLESITIPFVGESRKTANDTAQYPFGYIFGTYSYTGGVATKQYFYGSTTNMTSSATFYIPSSLKSVTVTDGNILRGAFEACSGLTTITLGTGVKSIESFAFYRCSGLTSITYQGTKRQWNAISREPYWNDNTCSSIHCTDGDIAMDQYEVIVE